MNPIEQAAREYVAIRQRHKDHGPLLSSVKAAHARLIAAVEANPVQTAPHNPDDYALDLTGEAS